MRNTLTSKIPIIVDEIDLHGYTKEKAISLMTMFLSESLRKHCHKAMDGIWVMIITGTGKHSQQGPILRNAVQSTLEKRSMSYKMNYGKGSFMVRADSGFELHSDGPKRDTKVIIAKSLQRQPRNCLGTVTPVKLGTAGGRKRMNWEDDAPLPREVSEDDKAVAKAKIMSIEDDRMRLKEENRSKRETMRAIEDSLKLSKQEEEERRLMEEIICLSEKESLERSRREREEIEAAMRQSLEVCHEDEEINAAIKKSLEPNYNDDDFELAIKRSLDHGCNESDVKLPDTISAAATAAALHDCIPLSNHHDEVNHDFKDFNNVSKIPHKIGDNDHHGSMENRVTLGERMILPSDDDPPL